MSLRIRSHFSFAAVGARPAQEDHMLARPDSGVVMVADGFGGPQAGRQAARTACEAVGSFLRREAGDADATLPFVIRAHFSLAGNVLFNALVHANRRVCAENRGRNVHEKGGASIVAGYLDGELLSLANVGNCGAWVLREGKLAELVHPRSYARLLDPFARATPAGFDAPLTALGTSADVEPEVIEYRLRAGDWLILHTDGFSPDFLEELAKIQQKKFNIDQALGEIKSLFEYGPAPSDNLSFSLSII